MGAWGPGPFDSYTARDWLGRVRSVDDVREALRFQDDRGYAAAGLVAWAVGGSDDAPVEISRRELAVLEVEACRAVADMRCAGPLRTAWEGGDFAAWVGAVEELERALGGDPGSRPTPPLDLDGGEDEPDYVHGPAPMPSADLPDAAMALYRAGQTTEGHLALPVELLDPQARIEHLPLELVPIGALRDSDDLLALERAPGGFSRWVRWSWVDGAVPADGLVEPLPVVEGGRIGPDGVRRFGDDGLDEVRAAWWSAWTAQDQAGVRDAERALGWTAEPVPWTVDEVERKLSGLRLFEALPVLEDLPGGADDPRVRKLATALLSRGMDQWRVAHIRRLVALGARATPLARRKAARRADGEEVLEVLRRR